jgi:hypothetical protein
MNNDRIGKGCNGSRTAAALAAMACAVVLAGCSESMTAPASPSVVSETKDTATGGLRHQAITMRAKVDKVNVDKRQVTLLGSDGTTETLAVSNDVKNLAQLNRGDEVVVTYYQAVAFDVLKKGAKGDPATSVEVVSTADEGQTPGGAALQTVTFVADVQKLDEANNTATLKGPEGNVRTVAIQNPAVFRKVKVGDRVEIRLAEAMAIDVQPAK